MIISSNMTLPLTYNIPLGSLSILELKDSNKFQIQLFLAKLGFYI